MKHKRIVSMIGALILIVSAVVLVTGCSQGNDRSNVVNGGGGNNGGGNNGGGTNVSINGVWRSTTPLSDQDSADGITDAYLAFDGQMHMYALKVRGVLYKAHSCAYTISGNTIDLSGRSSNFSINNNVLTIGSYMGSWAKVNTPTLSEVQNAPPAQR